VRASTFVRSFCLSARWILSGFYLLVMVWSLLYRTEGYQPRLALGVVGFTVIYGMLMLLLWPREPGPARGRAPEEFSIDVRL